MTSLLDSFWGRDVVLLRADSLTLRHEVAGLGRDRTFALRDVRDLRVSPPPPNPIAIGSPLGVWRNSNGWLAFDYGPTTIRFGAGVDEAEAGSIIERLRQRSHTRDAV